MEQQTQEKPRVKYEDFLAKTKDTLENYIERVIRESKLPGRRKMGESKRYSLQKIQRDPFAKVNIVKAKVSDYLDYGYRRVAEGVAPSTVDHDFTNIRTVLNQAIDVWEVEGLSLATWKKAKAELVRNSAIGHSVPRTRRPTKDEEARLLAHEAAKNAGRYSETDMVDILKFQPSSCRRISETCRLQVKHVDLETRMAWVYNLKNPKGKGFHAQYPLLGDAWTIVERRISAMGETPDPEAFVFDYNEKTCSQRHTLACKALSIIDLHLHDWRREGASRLFEQGYSVPEVAMVTLHLDKGTLLKHYTSLNPGDIHKGPAAKRGVPGFRAPTEAEKEAFLASLGGDDAMPAHMIPAAEMQRPTA